MKNYITHLAALLMVGFALCTTTSCGDDDDDVKPNTEQSATKEKDGQQGEDSGEARSDDYVTTGAATSITLWGATLACTINDSWHSDDKLKCTFGIVLSTDRDKLKTSGRNLTTTTGVTGNNYAVAVSSLTPATTYYYCAYVQMTGGTIFYSSLIKSFTTGSMTVTTGEATSVTANGATLSLSFDAAQMQGVSVSTIGVLVSTSATPQSDTNAMRFSATGSGSTYTAQARGLNPTTTYYYCAYVQPSGYNVCYSTIVKSFTTAEGSKPTGDYNYPEGELVDLGLSVKWASCNLGASAPEDYGYYFGWGCTEPYKTGENVGWELYSKYIGGSITQLSDCGTAKDPLQAYVYPNNKSIAGTKWDAARVKLGGSWRMPTKEEQDELRNNCTWTWTTKNGVNGYRVTSKKNTNSIFLPAAGYRYGTSLDSAGSDGYYWSASPYARSAYGGYGAYGRNFDASRQGWYDYYRYDGFALRPVSE